MNMNSQLTPPFWSAIQTESCCWWCNDLDLEFSASQHLPIHLPKCVLTSTQNCLVYVGYDPLVIHPTWLWSVGFDHPVLQRLVLPQLPFGVIHHHISALNPPGL